MTAPGGRPRFEDMTDDELREIARADVQTMPEAWRAALRAELARRAPVSSRIRVVEPTAGVYSRAPLLPRFLASVVDSFIGMTAIIVTGVLGFINVIGSRRPGTVLVIAFALSCIWMLYYMLAKDGRPHGQSVGKKMAGLMVVHLSDNQPCTREQSALRGIILLVLGWVPFVGWLIEPFALLIDDRGQRLGDRAAGTQVIEASAYRPNV